MPGPVLHVGAVITCMHGAPVQLVPGSPRVLLGGQPAATMTDSSPVAGCPFQIPVGAGTKPSPCVQVRWTVPATRVVVNGSPVLLQTSVGLGLSPEQAPQGPATASTVQPRVVAT
jgi:hypothetical protein